MCSFCFHKCTSEFTTPKRFQILWVVLWAKGHHCLYKWIRLWLNCDLSQFHYSIFCFFVCRDLHRGILDMTAVFYPLNRVNISWHDLQQDSGEKLSSWHNSNFSSNLTASFSLNIADFFFLFFLDYSGSHVNFFSRMHLPSWIILYLQLYCITCLLWCQYLKSYLYCPN